MKAYVYGANGAEITDVAKPSPKASQVLVRVRACGLNRADLGMTKGHVHGSAGGAGTVLGMEWAGEVAEVGADAKGVVVGDRVMGSGGAAFAEYTLADHGRLFHIPSKANMSFEDAAKLMMVSFDSTLKANLSVGLPLDLLVIERDRFEPLHARRIESGDPYFEAISSSWSEALRAAFYSLPDYTFDGKPG